MPFASKKRHEYWTIEVCYLDAVDEQRLGDRAYVISVLENHSRTVLASAVSRNQDLAFFLTVLYAAIDRYGSPEASGTDGGLSSVPTKPRPSTRRSGYAKRRSSEAGRGKAI